MRRNQFLGGIGKCMCFLAVCVMTFSSCYNDDDLKKFDFRFGRSHG